MIKYRVDIVEVVFSEYYLNYHMYHDIFGLTKKCGMQTRIIIIA